jgi:hypothetical protein
MQFAQANEALQQPSGLDDAHEGPEFFCRHVNCLELFSDKPSQEDALRRVPRDMKNSCH